MTLDVLIERYRKAGAFVAPPAETLPLFAPADYRGFLNHANGLQATGIILYGATPMESASGRDYPAITRRSDGIIDIGQTTDGAEIVFDPDSAVYLLLDRSSGDEYDRFDAIEALLPSFLEE